MIALLDTVILDVGPCLSWLGILLASPFLPVRFLLRNQLTVKERILEAAREKETVTYKGLPRRPSFCPRGDVAAICPHALCGRQMRRAPFRHGAESLVPQVLISRMRWPPPPVRDLEDSLFHSKSEKGIKLLGQKETAGIKRLQNTVPKTTFYLPS